MLVVINNSSSINHHDDDSSTYYYFSIIIIIIIIFFLLLLHNKQQRRLEKSARMKEREAKQRSPSHSQITQQGTGTRTRTSIFLRYKFSIAHAMTSTNGAGQEGKFLRILVTGGAGFLGRYAEGLLTRGTTSYAWTISSRRAGKTLATSWGNPTLSSLDTTSLNRSEQKSTKFTTWPVPHHRCTTSTTR